MTSLTSLLSPGTVDDPPLELGPPPGATARCRHCAMGLTADQLGWRHDQLSGPGWLCRDGQHLAHADPRTITPPTLVHLHDPWRRRP